MSPPIIISIILVPRLVYRGTTLIQLRDNANHVSVHVAHAPAKLAASHVRKASGMAVTVLIAVPVAISGIQ